MARERVQLGPGVPDLRALGVEAVGELIDGERLACAIEIASDGVGSLLRVPMPGTVGPDGTRSESPRGAGTGWLRLRRWRGGSLAERLRARFTAPRSASLAERAWNVACHLRAHGVGTPDLVAVGARGGGLVSKRSFLLTRELDGYESLERWLGEDLSADARRRGAVAIGSALGRIVACGAVLPRLDARSLFLSIEPDAGACQAESGGPRKNRLPSIVVSAIEEARIEEGEPLRRARKMLAALDASARERLRSCAGGRDEADRWRLRVLVRTARGGGLDRGARRRLREALVLGG